MRKLILAVIALLGFTLSTTAQQTPKKADKAKTETKKEEVKAPLKKDGTPDKRFKENKESKVVLKKDGTPDKRFKEKK
jgi:Na+-translocating ferredoxin:NAD+ oxidoreductase RnfG subunit